MNFVQPLCVEKHIARVFSQFDVNGTGFVTLLDLKRVASRVLLG